MTFLLLTYKNITQWLEANMISCPSKKFFHIECPGCGFQRSCIALLKGDLPASLQLYPAAIPIIGLAICMLLQLKYKFTKGNTIIKYLQAAVIFIIVLFYVYKIANNKIVC